MYIFGCKVSDRSLIFSVNQLELFRCGLDEDYWEQQCHRSLASDSEWVRGLGHSNRFKFMVLDHSRVNVKVKV